VGTSLLLPLLLHTSTVSSSPPSPLTSQISMSSSPSLPRLSTLTSPSWLPARRSGYAALAATVDSTTPPMSAPLPADPHKLQRREGGHNRCNSKFQSLLSLSPLSNTSVTVFQRGILYTSTAPLPMGYTTMGYTSMRYTSTALYFYKQFTQAPNKIFLKHFKLKICK
jgi:hypothetical protein